MQRDRRKAGVSGATAIDYGRFYNLESYLFETVTQRFQEQGYLDAFDFFCIVIWKANRAKSRIASNILASDRLAEGGLGERARRLTKTLSGMHTPKEKLRYLHDDLGFRLPMASAILTVLYPDEFTVYDVRVCSQLPDRERHRRLVHKLNFEKIWEGYLDFKRAVDNAAPNLPCLRDRDRYLWGMSFCEQLSRDIEHNFKKNQ